MENENFATAVRGLTFFFFFPFSCVNPVDPSQVIFHPVLADARARYPSHFKRFEVNMFAFAEDKDNLSRQVILALGKDVFF